MILPEAAQAAQLTIYPTLYAPYSFLTPIVTSGTHVSLIIKNDNLAQKAQARSRKIRLSRTVPAPCLAIGAHGVRARAKGPAHKRHFLKACQRALRAGTRGREICLRGLD